ncbi:MAG TPA: hypothetical protein VGQ26_23005, partial [Streptosporangiaceae bacterium]|nr:hypothetical protein [Streptosporangiaceae bacterium]
MRFGRLAEQAALVVGAAALMMTGFAGPAFASVSPTPASGTPQLAATGKTEQVRQLVQCGGMMYAVGSFTAIKWHGTTYARKNVFRFSASAPFTMSSWAPGANGKVNSIALSPGCSVAYLGGSF